MLVEAKVQEYQLKTHLKKINSHLFGATLLSFDESSTKSPAVVDSGLIGRFAHEPLVADVDVIDIAKLAVDNRVEKSIAFRADKVVPLTDDKYLVAVGNLLKIIDDAPHTFVEIRFDHEPVHFGHNGADAVFVMHHRNTWKNAVKAKNAFHTLSVYDFNLNLRNEIAPEMSILSATTNSQLVFVQLEKTFAVHMYNWSLERVGQVGQVAYVDKPFYLKDFVLRMVKNDRLFVGRTHANEAGNYAIRAVSLPTGEVLNEYFLNNNYENFFVDALSRTIVVDEALSSLKIFDKPSAKSDRAELIYENSLDLGNSNGHHMTHDGRFFFVKDKQSIQYFSFCKVA